MIIVSLDELFNSLPLGEELIEYLKKYYKDEKIVQIKFQSADGSYITNHSWLFENKDRYSPFRLIQHLDDKTFYIWRPCC